jgi:hypothetical protein
MKRAHDQLHEEVTYPHLATFLRSGGTLVVGEKFVFGAFARIRKGDNIFLVDAAYRDFAAILEAMNSKAKGYLEEESGRPRTPESE